MGKDRAKLFLVLGLLLGFNVTGWFALLALSRHYGFLFPLGILAFVFGLRHAVDADHIAAIDNTTRKLLNDGKKPLTVGLYFSLGHSTIVFLLALGLAIATQVVKARLPQLASVGGILGTGISAVFLYVIAVLNLMVLRDIYRVFRQVRQTRLTPAKVEELEAALLKRGLMNRVMGRAYRAISAPWQMYPVGVLFGLGFDTASEVALLGLSAFAAGKGMPIYIVLILPIMFAAGMSLLDTLDGILMQHAYAWAFLNPVRKVFYNLSVTTVSALVALGVGTVEGLQIIGNELTLRGPFWVYIQSLNFEKMGYFIIGILLASWGISVLIYKLKGYEKEITWEEVG